MSPAEYISSGILETYALGAATPAEMQDVENMLQKSQEIRAALEQIQLELEAYATLHALEPDEKLRDKILESISTAKQSNSPIENPKVIPLHIEASPSRLRSFAIAASLILVISIGVNLFQWKTTKSLSAEKQKADSAIQVEQAQRQLFVQRSIEATAKLSRLNNDLNFLRNPMTKTVALSSKMDDQTMRAVVYVDMATMQLAVDPMTLPATSADQKYVLWAMVKGKPVNVGDFDLEADQLLMMMKVSPEAEGYAISLEKSGDVTAPAGPVYVAGQMSLTKP